MIFIERSPQLRALGQHRRPEKLMSTVLSQYGRLRWDTSRHLIHKDHYWYRPTAIRWLTRCRTCCSSWLSSLILIPEADAVPTNLGPIGFVLRAQAAFSTLIRSYFVRSGQKSVTIPARYYRLQSSRPNPWSSMFDQDLQTTTTRPLDQGIVCRNSGVRLEGSTSFRFSKQPAWTRIAVLLIVHKGSLITSD